jgi:hypothetical protein
LESIFRELWTMQDTTWFRKATLRCSIPDTLSTPLTSRTDSPFTAVAGGPSESTNTFHYDMYTSSNLLYCAGACPANVFHCGLYTLVASFTVPENACRRILLWPIHSSNLLHRARACGSTPPWTPERYACVQAPASSPLPRPMQSLPPESAELGSGCPGLASPPA